MILYTMMPQELIYEQQFDLHEEQLMIENNGIPLLVSELKGGEYEILRILSSDPQHYLDSRYYPGTKIKI